MDLTDLNLLPGLIRACQRAETACHGDGPFLTLIVITFFIPPCMDLDILSSSFQGEMDRNNDSLIVVMVIIDMTIGRKGFMADYRFLADQHPSLVLGTCSRHHAVPGIGFTRGLDVAICPQAFEGPSVPAEFEFEAAGSTIFRPAAGQFTTLQITFDLSVVERVFSRHLVAVLFQDHFDDFLVAKRCLEGAGYRHGLPQRRKACDEP